MSGTESKPSIGYRWQEIADLPENLDPLRDQELESLLRVWFTQRRDIEGSERIKGFNAELAREWAIETGIIEGVYTLDRGITQTLIERGIDSSYIPHDSTNGDPELVARIIQAHEDVLEGLFAFVKGERSLTTGYVKELHAALLLHIATYKVSDPYGQPLFQELQKGAYKKLPNNPSRPDGQIHEYCPPEHVASEMDRLIELDQQHSSLAVPAYIAAAWLHHAFSQIHPFQDGNGRVARALASLVLIKSGMFPLVVTRDDRTRYIDALEVADQGELSPLVQLFAQLQKRALTKAIGRAADVKPVTSVEDAIAVTRDLLVDVGTLPPREYLKTKDSAARLAQLTKIRIWEVQETLTNDVSHYNKDYAFGVGKSGQIPLQQIQTMASKLQYNANTNDHHEVVVLWLAARDVQSRIVISFHSVGAAFRGLLAVIAYFQSGNSEAIPLSDDIFRISYEEPKPDIDNRYQAWLDKCIIQGLAEWRRTIV